MQKPDDYLNFVLEVGTHSSFELQFVRTAKHKCISSADDNSPVPELKVEPIVNPEFAVPVVNPEFIVSVLIPEFIIPAVNLLYFLPEGIPVIVEPVGIPVFIELVGISVGSIWLPGFYGLVGSKGVRGSKGETGFTELIDSTRVSSS